MKRVGQLYRENLAQSLRKGVEGSKSLFILSYSKLSSSKMGDLRKSLKQSGASVYVSRNSVARITLKEMKHEDLAEKVSGQTAFIWSNADSVEVSKTLIKFTKDIESVVLQGGLLEGKTLSKEDVKKLSELPSKQVLFSQLLGTIQAPLTRFAGALNAKSRDLLSIMKQLSEKKGGK